VTPNGFALICRYPNDLTTNPHSDYTAIDLRIVEEVRSGSDDSGRVINAEVMRDQVSWNDFPIDRGTISGGATNGSYSGREMAGHNCEADISRVAKFLPLPAKLNWERFPQATSETSGLFFAGALSRAYNPSH
jgi:hypothetical protein